MGAAWLKSKYRKTQRQDGGGTRNGYTKSEVSKGEGGLRSHGDGGGHARKDFGKEEGSSTKSQKGPAEGHIHTTTLNFF